MNKVKSFTVLLSISMVLFFGNEASHAQNWESTNGPYGGPVQCFTENSGFLFAGTSGNIFGKGIFRSANHGATWTTANTGLNPTGQGLHVQAMEKSGSYVVASTGTGIYRSGNDGGMWTVCGSTGTYAFNDFITAGSYLYAGGYSGLYVSTDNGLTWTAQNNNFPGVIPPNVPDIQSFAISGSYLYASTYGYGIFRSADNGLTWGSVNNGLGSPVSSRNYRTLGVYGSDVFVGTSGYGVYRLLNNGTTWTQEITGLPAGQARYVTSLLVKDNSVYIGCSDGILYQSGNAGTISWSPSAGNQTSLRFGTLFQSGSDIFSATDKGVQISTDNTATWSAVNQGILGLLITSIAPGSGTELFAAATSGVGSTYFYRSVDFGTTWVMGNKTGMPYLCNNYLFIYQTNLGVYRSADNGATWQFIYDFGTLCSFYSMGTRLFATITCCETIYFSDDNGETWTPSTLLDLGGFWGNVILSLTNDGTNMYAGTLNSGVLKSTDHGETFTALNPTMGNIPIRSIVTNGTYIFAGTSNYYEDPNIQAVGIYRSGDNGLSWALVNNGLTSLDIGSMVISGTDLYAGTKAGVYKSTNNGVTWTSANLGFVTPPNTTSLAVSGNYLFANNWVISLGDPVFRRELSGTAPVLPGAINGSTAPCIGSSQTYSVPNVPGVTYTWQFPAGWAITAGGITNSVTVTVGSTAGVVLVTPTNGWGSGPAQYMIVFPNSNSPAQPSVISGKVNPLEGTTENYSVTNDPGTAYTWSFPAGWVQTAGGTTSSVTVIVGAGSGNIQATPSTPCGTGPSRTLAVTTGPANISVTGIIIAGGQTRCYNASGTIVVAGNGNSFVVQNGGHATFIAGQTISFLPGTTVEPGGYLLGTITATGQYCGALAPVMMAVTGTEEPVTDLKSQQVRVYPNPTAGAITIEVMQDHACKELQVDIYDMMGSRIISGQITGEKKHQFMLGEVPAGIYLVRIVNGGMAKTVKIIKK
ncbi:MAG: T9SS type A sorting domain-containing protein [Bacteroidetes bacterium]|nr:T9SS type A sorting domain-containing protein [Bacteroidota bacterium]